MSILYEEPHKKYLRACLVQPMRRGGEGRGGIFKEGRRGKT
jgi:hypothetical protein